MCSIVDDGGMSFFYCLSFGQCYIRSRDGIKAEGSLSILVDFRKTINQIKQNMWALNTDVKKDVRVLID